MIRIVLAVLVGMVAGFFLAVVPSGNDDNDMMNGGGTVG